MPLSRLRSRPPARVGLWLFLAALALAGPFVQRLTAQPASRYALSAAIVDRGTVSLERYEHALGVDRAEHDGTTYSDKPPGQPVLGAVPYAVHRAVGGEPATRLRVEENLGLWWVTLWSSVVPFAATAVLMWLLARRTHDPGTALVAAVAVAASTLLLPFGTLLYGHVLAGALMLGCWLLASPTGASPARLAAAGAVGGLALSVEYQAALVAVGIGVWALVVHRARALVMAAAALPFAAGVVAYQAVVFGHPLQSPVGTKGAGSRGAGMLDPPDVGTFLEVVGGSRGLVYTPLALVAAVGLVLAVRRGVGRHAVAALSVVALFVAVQSGWPNPWGGEMPGPRYVVPALPFLVVGAAEALRRWRVLTLGAAAVGAVTALLATVTDHLVPLPGGAVGVYAGRLVDGEVSATLLTMAVGPAGWVLHAALVAGAGWRLVAARRAEADGLSAPRAAPAPGP